MGMMVQFPSPALWQQVLNSPPVSREQGTRNPIGGFTDMVHAQLVNQNAIAGLQTPPPRQPAIQRAPQKDARERRNPRDQQDDPREQNHHNPRNADSEPPPPAIRAIWA
jgi:hypothetical protein